MSAFLDNMSAERHRRFLANVTGLQVVASWTPRGKRRYHASAFVSFDDFISDATAEKRRVRALVCVDAECAGFA